MGVGRQAKPQIQMSEYQYYEFRVVDRPLTSREMASLRAISSRARITSTSFVNTYNYGNFRGDPQALMEKYFDAFVYVANWGTHEFMLRLPKKTLGRAEYAPFCKGHCLRAWTEEEHVLLSFCAEELETDWEEGEGWMDSLLPLRADLLAGDLRPLYLGWLLAIQHEEVDDDHPEPPIPAGLRKLSEPLNSLAEFLDIDTDLLESAAEASADLEVASPPKDLLERWIAGLPEREKDALLLQVAAGENPHVRVDLLRRFQSTLPAAPTHALTAPRTAGQLGTAAEMRSRERARREQERQRLEREREVQQKAAERTKLLDALEKREEAAWAGLDNLINTKRPADYDRVVLLLVDLRDVALRGNRDDAFQLRLRSLLERHAGKPSFLRRLKEANLEVR